MNAITQQLNIEKKKIEQSDNKLTKELNVEKKLTDTDNTNN